MGNRNYQSPGGINPNDVANRSSTTSPAEVVNDTRSKKGEFDFLTALDDHQLSMLIQPSLALALSFSVRVQNYEWIASGQQRQVGLDHPDDLTVELNSRRMEHQMTEKWRRDRIRSAVGKMAAVLPPQDSVRGKRKRSDVASTIEAATEYIQALQDELTAFKRARLAYR